MSILSPQNDHQKGLLIAISGVMLLSLDTPLLRLIDGNQWTIMFWRGLLLYIGLSAWWLWSHRSNIRQGSYFMGPWGLWVSLLYGLNNIFFIIALHHTSVANLLIIMALTPLVCALLSLVFLSEKISLSTWLAIAFCFLGVSLIIHDGIGTENYYGNFMAVLSVITLAGAIVFTRKSGQNLTTTPAFAGLIAAVFAYPFAQSLALDATQWGLMFTDGIVVMAIAFGMLAYAPTLLPAAQVAMFYLLETVFGPLWVWLVVGEQPSKMALIGGAVVIVTLIVHSTIDLRSRSR